MIEFLKKHWLVLLILVVVGYVTIKIVQGANALETWFLKLAGWALIFAAAVTTALPVAVASLVFGGFSLLNNYFNLFPGFDWIGKFVLNFQGQAVSGASAAPAINDESQQS